MVQIEHRGRKRVLSCVGDHILPEFYTLYLTKFRTPRQKPRREGASDRKTPAAKSLSR